MIEHYGLTLFGVALALLVVLVVLSGVRYIPNDRVGVIEKRWSLKGSVKSGFIALGGEAVDQQSGQGSVTLHGIGAERGDLGILLGEDVGKARSVLTSVDSFASTASASAQTSRGPSLVTAPDIARIGAATHADVEVTASGSPTPMVRSSTEITPSTRSCGSTTGTASSEFGTYPMRSATSRANRGSACTSSITSDWPVWAT